MLTLHVTWLVGAEKEINSVDDAKYRCKYGCCGGSGRYGCMKCCSKPTDVHATETEPKRGRYQIHYYYYYYYYQLLFIFFFCKVLREEWLGLFLFSLVLNEYDMSVAQSPTRCRTRRSININFTANQIENSKYKCKKGQIWVQAVLQKC